MRDDDGRARAASTEAYIRILLDARRRRARPTTRRRRPTPSLVIIVKPFPDPPARTFTEGIRVSLVGVRRNHPQALNPMIKSNNLLNNALAMQEALRRGADEALMQNQAGELVECSQSNFFIVRERPGADAAARRRVCCRASRREFVLELADELGVPARETQADAGRSRDGRRGVHHRHDARSDTGDVPSTIARSAAELRGVSLRTAAR